jgi:hypothetical protein
MINAETYLGPASFDLSLDRSSWTGILIANDLEYPLMMRK